MSFPVSGEVIPAIVTRMANATYGFNPTYNSLAAGYGITGPNATMAIDWSGTAGKSRNFVQADVDVSEWEESGVFTFPLVSLFSKGGVNENLQKYHQYSGPVKIGMNVFLSWREERLKINVFEPVAWCVEETVITVMNRARNAFPGDQEWGDGSIVYNGDLSFNKSKVARGGMFWWQQIAFEYLFEVHQVGVV